MFTTRPLLHISASEMTYIVSSGALNSTHYYYYYVTILRYRLYTHWQSLMK